MKVELCDIRVGDRVRDRFGVLSLVAAIDEKEIRYSDVEHGQTFSTVPRSMTPELVAHAVYMTPERIDALANLDLHFMPSILPDAMNYDGRAIISQAHIAIFREMLKEASA